MDWEVVSGSGSVLDRYGDTGRNDMAGVRQGVSIFSEPLWTLPAARRVKKIEVVFLALAFVGEE